MNREIKFRAWVKYLEMMVEVEHLHRNGDILPRNFADVFKAEGVALMQFTGLKSKSGVEIYEGDVVRIGSKAPVEVRWHKDTAGFLDIGMELMGNTEVIGNVWENPELLKP